MTEPTGRRRPTRVALFVTCLGDAFIRKWGKLPYVCCIAWELPSIFPLGKPAARNPPLTRLS